VHIPSLSKAVAQFKTDLEQAIQSATFNGQKKANGQIAKESLIRSSRLINLLHETVKTSMAAELRRQGIKVFSVHPPLGATRPELKVVGLLKAKDQDLVFLFDNCNPSVIENGPLAGQIDNVGQKATQRAIVIGVRSQMSSIAKNIDTLLERTFAETLNLRLRLNTLTMGEVYLLPVYEYDDTAMRKNMVKFKTNPADVEGITKSFVSISSRKPKVDLTDLHNLYRYDRTALIWVDFRSIKPRIYCSEAELRADSLISGKKTIGYDLITPNNFAADLISLHLERFQLGG
jgi:hypothetical protein